MTPSDSTPPLEPDLSSVKLRSHKIRIEVVQGLDAGVTADLPGPEARIGSGRDCDFVLTDPTVSRLHLRLRIEKDLIRVIDAGSRNGTKVDGVLVRDAYARPDSAITLGGSALRLRMLAEIVELPLSANTRFGCLLGRSVAMRRLFALLERAAPSERRSFLRGRLGQARS